MLQQHLRGSNPMGYIEFQVHLGRAFLLRTRVWWNPYIISVGVLFKEDG